MPLVKHKKAKRKNRPTPKASTAPTTTSSVNPAIASSARAQVDSLPSSASAAQAGHLAASQPAHSPALEAVAFAEPSPPSPTAMEIADQLHSAAIHLLRRLRVRDRETSVGPAQLSALSVLVFGGPKSLGELADAEQVRPPTMSRIVSGLQRAGLVRRHATEDGRRVRLEATPKGVSLMWEARKCRVESLANAVAGLPENQRQRLQDAINLLRQVLRNL
ncbi:MAG TPA: MarR family transcriptional regulator [Candidatus Acidoferrum sp.]